MTILYLACIISFELAFAFTGVTGRYPYAAAIPVVIYGACIIMWRKTQAKRRGK